MAAASVAVRRLVGRLLAVVGRLVGVGRFVGVRRLGVRRGRTALCVAAAFAGVLELPPVFATAAPVMPMAAMTAAAAAANERRPLNLPSVVSFSFVSMP